MPARPLIWPLLDRLNPPVAFQRRPKSAGNLGLVRLPTVPWDDADRPPSLMTYGNVESDPTLAEFRPWNFGLATLGLQSILLQQFRTNPRAVVVSEQRHEPGCLHPLGLWQFLPPAPPPRDDRQTSRIIWPLMKRLFFNPNRVVTGSPDNINLRAAVPGRVALQQNPKASPQKTSPSLPWARISGNPDLFGVLVKPSVVHINLPARVITITGVTRDSAGAILGGCVVELYDTVTNLPMMLATSDATTGVYTFICAKLPPGQHYIVAYKAGGTDVSGTTANTIVGA